jgi:solute carrier family 15 (peptide/histidine transporter), member 3/4
LRNKTKKFVFCESTRLIFGMGLSALAVVVAGLIESFRLNILFSNPKENILIQIIDNTTYQAANLHILWQVPQYTLVGLGEVFCSVTCLFYAYSAAPKSMQSILMGLFYFFNGFGAFVGSLILLIFEPIVFASKRGNKDDINCTNCHLNYYFYFLAVLQIIGMLLFILFDYKYSIARPNNKTDSVKSNDEIEQGVKNNRAESILENNNLNNDNAVNT